MPSDVRGERGRSQIYNWRVKMGKKEVFSSARRGDCVEWMRKNAHLGKLRLVMPNKMHK